MAIKPTRQKELREAVNAGHPLIPVRSKEEMDYVQTILDRLQTESSPETAIQFLNLAEATMAQRGKDYDSESGERSMGRTVTAFNVITGHELKESDGWLFMELLKNVRQYQSDNYHEDSAIDGVAYSALKAEALARGD